MKLLILIIMCVFTFSGCLPLLVGGAVGYGISRHNEHERQLAQEQARRENENIAWEMYRRHEIDYWEYRRLMRETNHLPPVGLERPGKPYAVPEMP
jgi:hypothetical protein